MNKLAIGTAAFGLDYGISNNSGRISLENSKEILIFAEANKIDTIDTAIAYGESESILGRIGVKKFNIISKLPSCPSKVGDLEKWVKKSVTNSLNRLRVDCLHGLMIHNANELMSRNGEKLFKTIQTLKKEGLVKNIGVSIYQPSDLNSLLKNYDFDIVQAPFNIFDRRLALSGWIERLSYLDIELHVRSVFLQGLLLMKHEDRPQYFKKWSSLWNLWEEWLILSGISPIQACIGYVLSYSEIAKVIVGVQSQSQLQEILKASVLDVPQIPEKLFSNDINLINPSNWKSI